MDNRKNYDSTVARIAGNILSGSDVIVDRKDFPVSAAKEAVRRAVCLAHLVVDEVQSMERTRWPMPETTIANALERLRALRMELADDDTPDEIIARLDAIIVDLAKIEGCTIGPTSGRRPA